MERFIASDRIVEIVLGFMAVEAIALIAYWRKTGRGLGPLAVLFMLGPGVCLLLALRAALMGAGMAVVCAWLGGALIAHLADLWQRQRGR